MSAKEQPLPSHQQLVDTIVKLDMRLDEQAKFITNQGEIIKNLNLRLEQAERKTSDKSDKNGAPSDRERLPMLEKFRGNRNIWDEWHLGASHKLAKDGPVIGDGFDQFTYIFSRLEGEAVKMVSTTAKTLSITRTGDGLKFLEYLNTVFGDPNKKARAQQQLYGLRQREKESFATFLPKFETVLATAGWSVYADDQKISLLKNALSKEMRTALIGQKLSETWSECISELLTISSEIIAINHQFKPNFSGPPSSSKLNNSPTAMDWEPVRSIVIGTQGGISRHAKWVKKETLAYRKKMGLCIRCGNMGHVSKNCNFLPPLNQNMKTNMSQVEDDEEDILALAESEAVENLQGKDELL